jgi:long-subunit fatty acid transport protein
VFLNTKSAVFDRNRFYMGLGYQLNEQIRLEAGYMNQLFENSGRDQLNLITLINF